MIKRINPGKRRILEGDWLASNQKDDGCEWNQFSIAEC
jgi:hypothetical protein